MKFPTRVKIAVVPENYKIELDASRNTSTRFKDGVEADFVEVLSRTLNFQYQLSIPEDVEWGRLLPNGQWSGLIGMVNRSEADLAVSELIITEAREDAVHFVPYVTGAFTIFTNDVPREVPNLLFFVHPFEYRVWLCLAVCLISMLFLLNRAAPEPSLSRSVLEITGASHKRTGESTTAKYLFLLGAWKIFTTFVLLAYGAVLLSHMTVPVRSKGIETFRELAAAIAGGTHKCYTARGSAMLMVLERNADASLRFIGRAVKENAWDAYDPMTYHEKLKTERNVAVIGKRSSFEMEKATPEFRDLAILEETIEFWNAGIAVRKDFCCKRELHKTVSRMRNAGIYQKLHDMQLHKIRVRSNNDSTSAAKRAVRIEHFYGTFALLVAGHAVSVAALVVEILCAKKKARAKK